MKSEKRLLALLLAFSQGLPAEVLIRGPRTSVLEYRAALKADADLTAPSEAWPRRSPSPTARENLLRSFAEAQKSYLSHALPDAQSKFQGLASLWLTEDWATADRQIFMNVFMRLAQMENEPIKKDYWLTRTLLLGEKVRPDQSLFPPPLLKDRERIKSELPTQEITNDFFEDGWNLIMINGVECRKGQCEARPRTPEKWRVTFVSDIWQPVTLILDSEGFNKANPAKKPWATGECAQAQLSPAALELGSPRVFWGFACESPRPLAKADNLNLQPTLAQNPTDEVPRFEIKESSSFYKKPWFWVAVGSAVAIAAVITANQNQKEKKEPTTTYGYE